MNRAPHMDAERMARLARVGAETLLLDAGARALDVLDTAGLAPDVLVVKGASLVGLVWEPGARRMVDVDLLVAPRVFRRARDAFARAPGWTLVTERGRPLGAHLHRAFTARADNGCLVDVHAHLAQAVRWPVPFADVAARSRAIAIGRRTARAPSVEDTVVLAALNEAKDEHAQHGAGLRDIARIAERIPVDWPLVVASARAWRATVAVWAALVRAQELHGAPVPAEVVAALRPRRAPALTAALRGASEGGALEGPRAHTARARRLRQATTGLLLTDSAPRFLASAAGFVAVRAVDAMVVRLGPPFVKGSS